MYFRLGASLKHLGHEDKGMQTHDLSLQKLILQINYNIFYMFTLTYIIFMD